MLWLHCAAPALLSPICIINALLLFSVYITVFCCVRIPKDAPQKRLFSLWHIHTHQIFLNFFLVIASSFNTIVSSDMRRYRGHWWSHANSAATDSAVCQCINVIRQVKAKMFHLHQIKQKKKQKSDLKSDRCWEMTDKTSTISFSVINLLYFDLSMMWLIKFFKSCLNTSLAESDVATRFTLEVFLQWHQAAGLKSF